MATTIATIRGTMLAPGVSKNNRRYTNEAIGRMVNRMKDRLNDPSALPVVMRTHHDAGDNSRLIVGRITSVQQESDGRATYEAKLYNTVAGRDIAALINPEAPALRTTSVFGRWVGPTSETREGGKRIEVGEDLAIEALDFTASPGVEQSRIDTVAFESHSMTVAPIRSFAGAVSEYQLDGVNVCETYEATVELDEEVDDEDLDVYERAFSAKQRNSMANKGQAMPGGRYPIASKGDLRNAIRLSGQGKGDKAAIRAYIKKRAAALGLSNMIPDGWGEMQDSDNLSENMVDVCIKDDNGNPIVKICATNVAYDDIKKAAKAAAKIAIRVIDPDQSDADDDDNDGIPDDLDPNDNGDDYNVSVSSGKNTNDMSVPSGGDSNTIQPAPGSYPSADRKYESEATDMSVLEVKVDGVNGLDNLIQALSAARTGMTPAAPAAETVTQEETAVSESEKTAAAAAPVGLSEADMTKLATLIGASVKEAMDAAADKFNAATKGKAKSKANGNKGKSADTSDNGPAPAESTSKANGEKNQVTETAVASGASIAEADRKKLVDELRESLIKEGAIPGRKGFRHVQESDTDVAPTGDELWDKRSEIWSQFFPWGQTQAVAAAPADAS